VQFLLADESNRNPSDRIRFFIYGGIIVPVERLPEIHDRIEALRQQYGIATGWDLKFDAASRPVTLGSERFAELKNEILQIAIACHIRFMAYVIHHGVISIRHERDRAFRPAMNTLLYTFNCLLRREETHGLFVVDRFDGAACLDLLKTVFTRGLDLPPRNARRAIDRICFMGASCVGASHLMSLLDIVVGAFRFCINVDQQRIQIARRLFRAVWALILRSPHDPNRTEEWGLLIRPQNVRAPHLIPEYRALRERLGQLQGNDA
jgi:FAD/FMN-containing dehydrogenase